MRNRKGEVNGKGGLILLKASREILPVLFCLLTLNFFQICLRFLLLRTFLIKAKKTFEGEFVLFYLEDLPQQSLFKPNSHITDPPKALVRASNSETVEKLEAWNCGFNRSRVLNP